MVEGLHLLSGWKRSLFYIFRKDDLGIKNKAFTASTVLLGIIQYRVTVLIFFERSLQFSLLLSEMIKIGTSFQHLF